VELRRRERRHWSLLSSHGQVLTYLSAHPDVTVRRVAEDLAFSERRIMGVLRDLEEAALLRRERHGRQNLYAVNREAAVREPGAEQVRLQDLLDTLLTPLHGDARLAAGAIE